MIKGWTDTVRFPRLGEIRLGEKEVVNGKEVPRALDYFVIPPEVQEIYGPQPRELDIMFPHESIDVVMPADLKRYGDQWGLICRGDGEKAALNALYAQKAPLEYQLANKNGLITNAVGEVLSIVQGQGGSHIEIPCLYKDCPHYKADRCREVVLVNVLLPKVAGVLGVYTITTGSYNSYTNLKNALEMLRAMVGRVSLIPLRLAVRMQDAHPEVGNKRIKTTIPVMYINMADFSLERMLELARQDRLAVAQSARALPSPAVMEIEPANDANAPEMLYTPERTATDVAPGSPGPAAPAAAAAKPAKPTGLADRVLETAKQLTPERLKHALEHLDPFNEDQGAWAARLKEWVTEVPEDTLQLFLKLLAIQLVLQDGEPVPELLNQKLVECGVQLQPDLSPFETMTDLSLEQLALLDRALRQAARAAQQNAAPQAGGTPAGTQPPAIVTGRLKLMMPPRRETKDGRQVTTCRAVVSQANGLRPNLVVTVAAEGGCGEALVGLRPGQEFNILKGRALAATSVWAEEVEILAAVAS